MPKVFITRPIPENGINLLKEKGYEVVMNSEDRLLSREALLKELREGKYDAVLTQLTEKIDEEVYDAAGREETTPYKIYGPVVEAVSVKVAEKLELFGKFN